MNIGVSFRISKTETSDRFITNKPNQATPTVSQVALEPMIINRKILCFSEPR